MRPVLVPIFWLNYVSRTLFWYTSFRSQTIFVVGFISELDFATILCLVDAEINARKCKRPSLHYPRKVHHYCWNWPKMSYNSMFVQCLGMMVVIPMRILQFWMCTLVEHDPIGLGGLYWFCSWTWSIKTENDNETFPMNLTEWLCSLRSIM